MSWSVETSDARPGPTRWGEGGVLPRPIGVELGKDSPREAGADIRARWMARYASQYKKAAKGSSTTIAVSNVKRLLWVPHDVITSNQASENNRVPATSAIAAIVRRRLHASHAIDASTTHSITSNPIHSTDQWDAS